MSDTPEDEARAKLNEAAAAFGQSLVNSMNLSFRLSAIKQIAKEFGPGPWILHEDGRVELIPKPKPRRKINIDDATIKRVK